eukprot:CAMPEP_0177644052 /NCGR_PEP_ID=MMETSP0447-20121125/8473_1 /TAXON_ID=0 /ORGANISM="Stygamoeba regulata, Strain BSH-02190019" /LENGTH=229 /DNA_ID=CAMNT_0019146369 /DNA_START=51 /DNA_END=740 /DNA_ORIENTATION=-
MVKQKEKPSPSPSSQEHAVLSFAPTMVKSSSNVSKRDSSPNPPFRSIYDGPVQTSESFMDDDIFLSGESEIRKRSLTGSDNFVVQQDDLFTQASGSGGDSSDRRWVTVFGFPPSDASLVLNQFQYYGEVVRHHQPSPNANWIDIQYRTSFEASNALSKNGKVIADNIMIGVLPKKVSQSSPAAQASSSRLGDHNATPFPKQYCIASVFPNAPSPQRGLWTKIQEYLLGY